MKSCPLPETHDAAYRFLMGCLSEMGIDSPRSEARIILDKRVGKNWINTPDSTLSDNTSRKIVQDLEVRRTGKPLSRIYGETEFWGRPFKLGADTLDPRQDSETLIDLALKRFAQNEPITILDLGTGSGCLLITLLNELPGARGCGVDISQSTLDVAAENARLNGVEGRAIWLQSDWMDSVSGSYDLIVANPPYIKRHVISDLDENVRNFDPILALDGGEDGLDCYKKIFFSLSAHLKPDGICLLEIGFDQADDVVRLGKESGFTVKGVHSDLSGNPRVVEISCGDK